MGPHARRSAGAERARPLSTRFDVICARSLAKEPGDRFPSAGDLGRAALAAADGSRVRVAERSVATGAAAPAIVAPRRHLRRRRRTVVSALAWGTAAGALVVTVAYAAGALSDGETPPENPAGRIVGSPVPLPHHPDYLAAGEGRVWGLAATGHRARPLRRGQRGDRRLPSGRRAGGEDYSDLAVGRDAVWIARAVPDVGGVDHVDPATGEAVQHVTFPLAAAVDADETSAWAVAAGENAGPGRLVRIDPVRDRITGSVIAVGRDPAAVAIGAGAVSGREPGRRLRVASGPATGAERTDRRRGRAFRARGDGLGRLGGQLRRPDAHAHRPGSEPRAGRSRRTGQGATGSRRVGARALGLGRGRHRDASRSRDGRARGLALSPAAAPLALAADGDSVWVGSSSDQTLTQIREGGP